ncbi:MAG: hypothetical protein M0011_11295 [Elusimicrobia bacterium]|nr:hypothetical protein [Elusimicrobiota bacterium]
MPLNYINYVMVIGLASLSVAAVTCAALWLMAPALFSRLRPAGGEPETGPDGRGPAEERCGVVFDFPPSLAPSLAALLAGESQDDTAIVVSCLRSDTAAALLSVLEPPRRADVLASLAVPKRVDMDLLRGMKAELENRLYGSVGGAALAADLIRAMPRAERGMVLQQLASRGDKAGNDLRGMFLLEEDLDGLSDRDVGALAGAVQPADMARFLPALPEKLRSRLKGAYKDKAAAALEKAAPRAMKTAEKEAAAASFIGLVEKLSAKGIVTRPGFRPKAPVPEAADKDDRG